MLSKASPIVEYAIKRDLACMTSLPFYMQRPKVIRFKILPIDLIKEYIDFFKTVNDKQFIFELLRKLSINQSQTLRKAAHRIGNKNDIWEHVIPTKVLEDEIIKMLKCNDISELRQILEIYCKAGQRPLTYQQNNLLDEYRSSMPSVWDWRDPNVYSFAKHRILGIEYN